MANQMYPFEKNRYYPGKMLTSADFQAEQDYFVNRLRFSNVLMYGSGIVCGLGTFSLDDLSILIESGVAIDGEGREIIVDNSVVKKLSAIDGFDTLKTDRAVLCLKYNEKEVHSVYSVNSTGNASKEYEYNRISEGYGLFLTDKENLKPDYVPETEFLVRERLLKSDNFIVEVMLPGYVSKGRNVRLELVVTKLTDADVELTADGLLETPLFVSANGENTIAVECSGLKLKKGEVWSKEYWMKVMPADADDTAVILRSGSAHAYENDTAVNVANSFRIKVIMSDATPLELVTNRISMLNLEMMAIGSRNDYIRLAEIKLLRTDNAYVIDKIIEDGVKKYITAPGQEYMRNHFISYYEKDVDITERAEIQQGPVDVRNETKERKSGPEVATGVLEIPLGRNVQPGDVKFSGEITHGLGKGNVYVQLGYEHIDHDESLGMDAKNTVYGNPSLFETGEEKVDAEVAVKVLNDKGSFVAAAKLLRSVNYLVLTYRWVAIKFPAGNDLDMPGDYYDKSISAETPTVVLGLKESHYFGVRFHNMPQSSIAYELTAPGSGEISADGIYVAPAKEGVYEIRIYCTDMPVVCTYAYAIVKKITGDETEA